MQKSDVVELGSGVIVLCSDGNYGMLVSFPTTDELCGIQVPGEHEHRWIESVDLCRVGEHSLSQLVDGTISEPPLAASDMEQLLLHMVFVDDAQMT